MSLKKTLLDHQLQAMRQGDRLKVSVLRLLRSAVGYEEKARRRELDDIGVLEVVSRQIRQRHESIEGFRQGRRDDLVQKEEAELAILKEYLPPQLSREELVGLVKGVIAEVGAEGPRDKGKVMGRLMPQVRGKAQGSEVSAVVDQLLAESPET